MLFTGKISTTGMLKLLALFFNVLKQLKQPPCTCNVHTNARTPQQTNIHNTIPHLPQWNRYSIWDWRWLAENGHCENFSASFYSQLPVPNHAKMSCLCIVECRCAHIAAQTRLNTEFKCVPNCCFTLYFTCYNICYTIRNHNRDFLQGVWVTQRKFVDCRNMTIG